MACKRRRYRSVKRKCYRRRRSKCRSSSRSSYRRRRRYCSKKRYKRRCSAKKGCSAKNMPDANGQCKAGSKLYLTEDNTKCCRSALWDIYRREHKGYTKEWLSKNYPIWKAQQAGGAGPIYRGEAIPAGLARPVGDEPRL